MIPSWIFSRDPADGFPIAAIPPLGGTCARKICDPRDRADPRPTLSAIDRSAIGGCLQSIEQKGCCVAVLFWAGIILTRFSFTPRIHTLIPKIRSQIADCDPLLKIHDYLIQSRTQHRQYRPRLTLLQLQMPLQIFPSLCLSP